MSSNLHQSGVRLLRMLGRHAETVMDVYLSGAVDEANADAGVLKKLTEAGILWRPEED